MTNQPQKLLKKVCIIFRVLDASVLGLRLWKGGFELELLARLSVGILPLLSILLSSVVLTLHTVETFSY